MWLRDVRWSALALGFSNLLVVILGAYIVLVALPLCGCGGGVGPFAFVTVAAAMRIAAMVRIGVAQKATAMAIVGSSAASGVAAESALRLERRIRYKRWLWWSRTAMLMTVLQFCGASFVMFNFAKHISHDGASNNCVLGLVLNGKWSMLITFMGLVCFVALAQCFTGSDVLRWRSFYATQDSAWKSHYREIFDHGIREAFCCLGRVKYMSMLEEDEIYGVAQLLGDLVAYRASGTGHLEFLAGLALLQRRGQSPVSYEGLVEAPAEIIQEALTFHQFAEAAYTGPLLDLGRHLVFFPCAWLYRQGILTSWTRNRRPRLEGDNWWRGHAAAFLNCVNLSPEVLRRGRVRQKRCEAAYFIVVLHHLRSVVIAVRGTETPEDLLTDGFCEGCCLSEKDLGGLLNNTEIQPELRHSVLSSFPHYGHSGIVEAARDLSMQVDGHTESYDVESPDRSGFLSSLLGVGCECEGYNIRIVGHSLGGAIAAFLGLRLYGRYSNVHVYTYGSPPCVDSVIADACSDFVTSIVYNNEFSSRLSVGSVTRLRAAAVKALQGNTSVDAASIFRLASKFLYVSRLQERKVKDGDPILDFHSATSAKGVHPYSYEKGLGASSSNSQIAQNQDIPIWKWDEMEDSFDQIGREEIINGFSNEFRETASDVSAYGGPIAQFVEAVPSFPNGSAGDCAELFLPGRVIHIAPEHKSFNINFWNGWSFSERAQSYKAYLANRESFKDISVSPSMFLDHLPWRCHYAMQKVLERQSAQMDVPQLV